MLIAAAIIVGGVALITAAESRAPQATHSRGEDTMPRHTGDYPVTDRA